MLINFSVENYKCFKEKTTLSMVVSEDKERWDSVPYVEKYNMHIAPIVALYGANASGKSAFLNALVTLCNFATDTGKHLGVCANPFRLDKACIEKPTNFEISILVDDEIYEYEISTTQNKIIKEKLAKLSPDFEPELLFERTEGKTEVGKLWHGHHHSHAISVASRCNRRNDVSFLAAAAEAELAPLDKICDAFNLIQTTRMNKLSPEYYDKSTRHYKMLLDLAKNADIGIEDIDIKSVNGKKYFETYSKDKNNDGDKTKICVHGGAYRLIHEVYPVIINALNSKRVYLADQFYQNLHANQVSSLIEMYMDGCSKNARSQLIITTHDVRLLGEDILRNDEVWFFSKLDDGSSELYSRAEFAKIENENLEESYLDGRFGGIPNITYSPGLWNENDDASQ